MKHLVIVVLLWTIVLPTLATAQDFTRVPYGPEDRQFVDLYLAPSNCPTPVYFDAHGNGGNTNMPRSITDDLKAAGISTVAWESLTSIETLDDTETGWADAELMFAWVKANAETYNFDTTNFIIGGSSRGSILSWKYGHRPDPNIKGLYMYNALPDGIWTDPTRWYPPDEVKVSSPPIFFVYKREPGVEDDSHDPENGLIIVDTYTSLGIGDRAQLVHSIGDSGNDDRYQFLVEFAQSVITPCRVVNTQAVEAPGSDLRVFPNPFRDQISVVGLSGGEQLRLLSAGGAVIRETDRPDLLRLGELSPGLYFLVVQTGATRRVLRLAKH